MSDISPQQPPTARAFLIQKLERFLTAVRQNRSMKELRFDQTMVTAALDDFEEESKRGAAA